MATRMRYGDSHSLEDLRSKKNMREHGGFQSFEELMAEIRQGYHHEKQEVDSKVMTTIMQQKNRMKEKECGIEYP